MPTHGLVYPGLRAYDVSGWSRGHTRDGGISMGVLPVLRREPLCFSLCLEAASRVLPLVFPFHAVTAYELAICRVDLAIVAVDKYKWKRGHGYAPTFSPN